MKIAIFYSHMNGYEYLLVHKPALWAEIQDVISSVDAEACRTKESKERGRVGQLLYSPVELNKSVQDGFSQRGWSGRYAPYWVTSDPELARKITTLPADEQKAAILEAGLEPIYSFNQTDYVKERVAVEVQLGKYFSVSYDLFVKHMAFFVANVIDVGVEIMPTKALQSKMSSGPGYYERELYNLMRGGRGVPAVPLILVGVEP